MSERILLDVKFNWDEAVPGNTAHLDAFYHVDLFIVKHIYWDLRKSDPHSIDLYFLLLKLDLANHCSIKELIYRDSLVFTFVGNNCRATLRAFGDFKSFHSVLLELARSFSIDSLDHVSDLHVIFEMAHLYVLSVVFGLGEAQTFVI